MYVCYAFAYTFRRINGLNLMENNILLFLFFIQIELQTFHLAILNFENLTFEFVK